MDQMHRRERVRAALAGNPVDRPQIGEVWQRSRGPVIGGVDHVDTLRHGTPEAVAALIRGAVEQTREGLLIGPDARSLLNPAQICGRPAPRLIRWLERLTAIQAEAAARMPVSFRAATRWEEAF